MSPTDAKDAPSLAGAERAYLSDAAPIHREDSDVEPYIDGEDFFRAMHEAIEAATAGDLIYILSWWFDPHCLLVPVEAGGRTAVGRQLVDKAAEGVDVRLILWANPFFPGPNLWSFGTIVAPAIDSFAEHSVVQRNIYAARLLRSLEAPGRSPTPPLADRVLLDWSGTWTSSHHQKALIVSNGGRLAAFLAGMDIAPIRWDRYQHPRRRCFMKDGSRQPCNWHDVGVKITGAATGRVMETFAARWRECEALPPKDYLLEGRAELYNPPTTLRPLQHPTPVATPTPGRAVQILRSVGPVKIPSLYGEPETWTTLPKEGVYEIRDTWLAALRAATTYIYVECQFLNREERVWNALFPPGPFFKHTILFPEIVAAANRGVKVVFVTSGRGDPYDGEAGPINTRLSATLQTSVIDQIRPAYRDRFVLYRVNHLTVHSKVLLIDDVFLSIGSANFFDRSLDGTDTELTVAAVDAGALVRDLRVRLWADHLRVDPNDPAVRDALEDPACALAVWRPSVWGPPPPLPLPAKPALRLVGPFV